MSYSTIYLYFALGTGRSISPISTLIFKGDMRVCGIPFEDRSAPPFPPPSSLRPSHWPTPPRGGGGVSKRERGKEDFLPVFERPLAPSSVLMAVHHLGRYRLCSTPHPKRAVVVAVDLKDPKKGAVVRVHPGEEEEEEEEEAGRKEALSPPVPKIGPVFL